jgi:hypothetical protein
MTYPRISAKDAQAVRDKIDAALTSGSTRVDVEARGFLELESTYVKYGDSGVTVDCDALYEAALSAQKDLITSGGAAAYKKTGDDELPFYVEELMSSRLHETLDQLDPAALYDGGFWRYLALFPYRWFLLERERTMQSHDFGGGEGQRHLWLLIRTYQWGRKGSNSNENDPYANTQAVRLAKRRLGLPEGRTIDFYHSHIVRSRWADTSAVAGAFIESATSAPEATDTGQAAKDRPVAQMAKLVAYLSNNISLESLSKDEVRALIDNEKMRVLSSPHG